MRWARWLLQHMRLRHDVLVVNMDETMLSNQTQWRHGYHVLHRQQHGVTDGVAPREPRDPRTSLVATVCDRAEIQSALPQIAIRQRKTPGESANGRRCAAPYVAPADVWYNSTGMMDAACLRRFLVRLRCAVRAKSPATWIILVLDCSPLHLSINFLRFCSRLGVVLLYVPALTTWFLQALDVYVFSSLKRQMSAKLHAGVAALHGHRQNTEQRLAIQVASARETLQAGTWERALLRCGVTMDTTCMRQPLIDMALGTDLKARPPTEEELAELLGRHVPQASRMLPLLLGWPERLRDSSFALRPPGWCLPRCRVPEGARPQHRSGGQLEPAAGESQPNTTAGSLPHAIRLGPPALAAREGARAPRPPGPTTGRRSLHPVLEPGVLHQREPKRRRM